MQKSETVAARSRLTCQLVDGANAHSARPVVRILERDAHPGIDRAQVIALLETIDGLYCNLAIAPLDHRTIFPNLTSMDRAVAAAMLALVLQRRIGFDAKRLGRRAASPLGDAFAWVEVIDPLVGADTTNVAEIVLIAQARGAPQAEIRSLLDTSIDRLIQRERARGGERSCSIMTRMIYRVGLPVRPPLPGGRFWEVGIGAGTKRYESADLEGTTVTAAGLQQSKRVCSVMLSSAGISVPQQRAARSLDDVLAAAAEIGYPLVLKPEGAGRSKGVVLNIRTEEELRAAHDQVSGSYDRLVIERYFIGRDYRIVTVDGEITRAYWRRPPTVTGDGTSTIAQLIERHNAQPALGPTTRYRGGKMNLDMLAAQDRAPFMDRGLTMDSVVPAGEEVRLMYFGLRSVGGRPTDVTDQIHPDYHRLARRIHRMMPMRVSGIDVIAKDITAPMTPDSYAVNEVNYKPALGGYHVDGLETPGADQFIRRLLGDLDRYRVPVVLIVTGGGTAPAVAEAAARALAARGASVTRAASDGCRTGDFVVDTAPHASLDGTIRALRDLEAEAIVLERDALEIEQKGLGVDQVDLVVFCPSSSEDVPLMFACAGFAERISRRGALFVGHLPPPPGIGGALSVPPGRRCVVWTGAERPDGLFERAGAAVLPGRDGGAVLHTAQGPDLPLSRPTAPQDRAALVEAAMRHLFAAGS